MRLLSFEPDRVLTVLIPTTSMLKYKGEEQAWQVFSAEVRGFKRFKLDFRITLRLCKNDVARVEDNQDKKVTIGSAEIF